VNPYYKLSKQRVKANHRSFRVNSLKDFLSAEEHEVKMFYLFSGLSEDLDLNDPKNQFYNSVGFFGLRKDSWD
jgi:hypothetical protein